jgi:hypothetical protein
MADEKLSNQKQVKPTSDDLKGLTQNISDKTGRAIYGMGLELDRESDEIRDIIRQTMTDTSAKYGSRANGKVIDYFNELNFSKAFFDLNKDTLDAKTKKEAEINPDITFKKYMSERDIGSVSELLAGETPRITMYGNYRAIYNHIPEAAQALDTFKDNIMSPDDFTKLIFNLNYDNDLDADLRNEVLQQLEDLSDKYELSELADEVISGSLLYGDQFVAILSIESEMSRMMDDPLMKGMGTLNEDVVRKFDIAKVDIELNKTDIHVTKPLLEAFAEGFVSNTEDGEAEVELNLTEDNLAEYIASLVNNNVIIGSKNELLLERISAELQHSGVDIPDSKESKKRGRKAKNEDNKPLYVNGSTIKILDPSKVVELKVDNTVYGYYYAEDSNPANLPNSGYLGQSTGRENNVNMGANMINVNVNNSKFTPQSSSFTLSRMSDSKSNLIASVFIDSIAKKVNKDFIRHNKEFKDFIFALLKQDYIMRKEVKLIYFLPEEVVAFKVPAIYRKITFFAKLYLAMLTNTLLVKMGRAHDKRVFYVDVGADADYEQSIVKVIQDIKTKEFKMDSINDVNTILNLNPGAFDNYYIPTINGEKPIDIETLPGMDMELNNEFLEFLRTSMMTGIGVPRTLIDETVQTDFARTLSARNANFVRSIIQYQRKLTLPFTKILRRLYKHEYAYSGNQVSNNSQLVNENDISVSFPSPATLNMTNIADQIQIADANASFAVDQMVFSDPTGSNDEKRMKLKAKIIRELLPAIDWDKYDDFLKEIEIDEVGKKAANPNDPMDPYGGMQPY